MKFVLLCSVFAGLSFLSACSDGASHGLNNSSNNGGTNNTTNNGTTNNGTTAGSNNGGAKSVQEAEPNGYADGAKPTPFNIGDSISGTISEGSKTDSDFDRFSVDLEAGDIVELTLSSVGEGFGENFSFVIHDENEDNLWEHIKERDGVKRQFFAPTTGTYSIVVSDLRALTETTHGGSESAYLIETESIEATPELFALQGQAVGVGVVDVYKLEGTGSLLSVETVATREPVSSDLDTKLWIFDPETKTVIAYNDDLDFANEGVDSKLSFYAKPGKSYWVVVDAFELGNNQAYNLNSTVIADSAQSPISFPINSKFTNNISDVAGSPFNSDFYEITLKPGDGIRIVVESDGNLQPRITGTLSTVIGDVQLLEGREENKSVIVELVHSSAATQNGTYIFQVDDQRNVNETIEDVGGDDFGYSITAKNTSWTKGTIPHPASFAVAQGEMKIAKYDLPETTFLGLYFSANQGEPIVAFINEGGNASEYDNATALVNGSGTATHYLGVREKYFRSADITTLTKEVDLSTVGFSPSPEVEPNDELGGSQALSLPAAILGEATGTGLGDINADYYTVSLSQGDFLSIFVSQGAEGPIADTVVQLLDAAGNLLIENDDYPGQTESFFSGIFTEIKTTGTYVVRVQPFCSKPDNCSGEGTYRLNVFLAD